MSRGKNGDISSMQPLSMSPSTCLPLITSTWIKISEVFPLRTVCDVPLPKAQHRWCSRGARTAEGTQVSQRHQGQEPSPGSRVQALLNHPTWKQAEINAGVAISALLITGPAAPSSTDHFLLSVLVDVCCTEHLTRHLTGTGESFLRLWGPFPFTGYLPSKVTHAPSLLIPCGHLPGERSSSAFFC